MSTQQYLTAAIELESQPRSSADDSETTLVDTKPLKKRSRKQSVAATTIAQKPAKQIHPDNKVHANREQDSKTQPKNQQDKKTQSKSKQDSKPQSKKALFAETLGGSMASSIVSPVPDAESNDLLGRLKHAKALSYQKPDYEGRMIEKKVVTSALKAQVMTMDIGSTTSLAEGQSTPRPKRKSKDIHTFTLDDFAAISALSTLVEKYGRVSHMGVLDPSYSFFMSKDRQAALYYKVKNNIAVVGGEPLCSPDRFDSVFEEFRRLRKHRGWGIALLGASDSFLPYANEKKWVTMRFGTERVLNPLTNPVLQEKEGKRIITQNKQMLDEERGGISVHVYVPAQGRDELLEQQLRHIYDSWRDNRNNSSQPQAYMTVFDPFAIPVLMTYIYTRDREGQCNGFAALRKIGADNGYHIDPYCALPTAPRGVTDLLVFSAMSLLQHAGIGYLSFGFEPATELGEVTALSRPMASMTKSCYRRAFRHLPIGGKKAYHDKFRPDPELESGLYIVYPDGTPSIQHALATLHIANIKVRGLLHKEVLGLWKRGESADGKKEADSERKNASNGSS
ncbi:hypothetical protein LTR10_021213 [Elasticomyces elasticus]|uniref:Phosphatidylglycerol lysyltransferase C-terminal domain-containing protein n=1 Tax=Exophiala sideris TaxID=1016849 RepID=A0ABR0IYG6_9EURO|nr:hypothetical protein LTR10_021213 [Elasticomyces elasticus]KAK5022339.1 hypothetical protein LTS07_010215 [Exophiala sideris]KAK5027151.1 hypothetical protein LTR13_009761 [Exophiala sideris]KAK5051726.1 hypothetical protein LTR69_010226 [Exophiala sideris]KAK5177691.1 hypothetical protein LTR44_009881 [Eurotiomycetes sp. CCFEE 6388]